MIEMTLDELLDAPLTLDALPENTPQGTSATVTACATPDADGRPCRVVVDQDGTCDLHGRPADPHRVTVGSAWDAEGNRTLTHSMWRCRSACS